MSAVPLRVVKVGGSLLTFPELKPRLSAWLSAQPVGCHLLLAGGGALADTIRQAEATHRFSEETGHWLSIRAMTVSAHLLRELLAAQEILEVAQRLERFAARRRPNHLAIVDVLDLLQIEEARREADRLPLSRDVTSDSIAAHLAQRLEADELILLKSTPCPGATYQELADAGYVDAFFPRAARNLPRVRCINLRDETLRELTVSANAAAQETPRATDEAELSPD